MHLATGYEDRKPRIEIVPLIDVVFLLLVFFVYAMLSMVVYRGLRVELPSAQGVAEEMKTVIITLSADNVISMDGKAFDMQEVIAEAARKSKDTSYPVLISGDRAADLGVAIELLAGLRSAGISAVSFQVGQNRATEQ